MFNSWPLIKITDYVACFIPYKEEKRNGITPLLYGNNGVRYTMVRGYSPSKEFYAPDYKNSPLPENPDYRRTLYWNPDLKTDENGNATLELYNNSQGTSVACSVCGLLDSIMMTGKDN